MLLIMRHTFIFTIIILCASTFAATDDTLMMRMGDGKIYYLIIQADTSTVDTQLINSAEQDFKKKEYEKAFEKFKEASKHKSAVAYYYLGLYYREGFSVVTPDAATSAMHFFNAYLQGYSKAGKYLLTGEMLVGIRIKEPTIAGADSAFQNEDYIHAAAAYTLLSDKGNVSAMKSLANCYVNTLGVRQDFAKAAAYLLKASKTGDAESQNKLAILYYSGAGVKKSIGFARFWLEQAASKGDSSAIQNLSNIPTRIAHNDSIDYNLAKRGVFETDPLTYQNKQALKDADGNVYSSVKIGEQEWIVENWKCTKFNDGTPIPLVEDNRKWDKSKKPSYCWYDNNISNKNTYGALYNWYAVHSNTIAPKGWHIPTAAEWKTLEKYLISNGYSYDGSNVSNKIAKSLAAKVLWKEEEATKTINSVTEDKYEESIVFQTIDPRTGTVNCESDPLNPSKCNGWGTPQMVTKRVLVQKGGAPCKIAVSNDGVIGFKREENNRSGFSALPGGYRNSIGTFSNQGNSGYWWSAMEYDASFASNRSLFSSREKLFENDFNYKSCGMSIRLVRD